MNDEDIIKIFYNDVNKDRINSHYTRKEWLNKHQNILDYLNNRYKDSESLIETIYRIKHGIETRPTCEYCGKPVRFVNNRFRKMCSVSCSKKYIKQFEGIVTKEIILSDIVEGGILNFNKMNTKYLKEHGYDTFLNNIFPDTKINAEKLYRLQYNLTEAPKCLNCGKPANFLSFNQGYFDYCCPECEEKIKYKNKQITDEDVLDFVMSDDKLVYNRIRTKILKNFYLYDYLMNRYEDSHRILEIIYRIYHKIDIRPVCKICGKPAKFFNFEKGFLDTCANQKCSYEYSKVTCRKIDIEINDEYIRKIYDYDDLQLLGINSRDIGLANDGTLDYLINRFPDTQNPREAIYRILHGIEECPKCDICGKPLRFLSYSRGYAKCSSTCKALRLRKHNYKEKYGLDCDFEKNVVIVKNGCPIHGDIKMSLQLFVRRIKNNVQLCPICNNKNTTKIENAVQLILDKYKVTYQMHNRQVIKPYEIDFYLPDYNIGIECNGMFWHSIAKKGADYEISKLNKCNQKGIKIFFFWEFDIYDRANKIEQFIRYACSDAKHIKNEVIKKIDKKDAYEFIDKYSIKPIKEMNEYYVMYDGIDIAGLICKTNENVIFVNSYKYEIDLDKTMKIFKETYSISYPLMVDVDNEQNVFQLRYENKETVNPSIMLYDKKDRRLSLYDNGNDCYSCYDAGMSRYKI